MPLSGITYSGELEWRLAARRAGYRWHDFRELEGEMQSDIVAAYRTEQQIEAVIASEAAHETRSKSRLQALAAKLRGRKHR